MRFSVAKKCAWHAFYISRRPHGQVLFALGIDPTFGPGPELFWVINGKRHHVRLPTSRNPMKRGHFWHKLDGRYGWWRS